MPFVSILISTTGSTAKLLTRCNIEVQPLVRGMYAMNALCIQIQPEIVPEIDMNRIHLLIQAVARDQTIVRQLVIKEGDDNGPYTNFVFDTMDLKNLWDLVQHNLYQDEKIGMELTKSSIVTCEGKKGWDDYLLLHHYDSSEKIDSLGEA